jgi:WD40 repeat protein
VLWQDAELSSPFTVTLDPPSRSLAYVYCDWQDNAFAVTHVALESPPRARTLRSGVPCSVPNLSLAYDAGSDAVVFAAGLSGEIQIASFHDGTLRGVPLHEPVEASQALEAIAAFALSPDGELLAMVGADNQLCLWTFPALEPLGLCVNAGFVQNIGTCYCSPRSVASLAWSHDGQWLASASPQGDVLLRRRCDLQVVASQALPVELDDALPWRASFAPDDSGLIVEYGTYDLRTLLTYTRL